MEYIQSTCLQDWVEALNGTADFIGTEDHWNHFQEVCMYFRLCVN